MRSVIIMFLMAEGYRADPGTERSGGWGAGSQLKVVASTYSTCGITVHECCGDWR